MSVDKITWYAARAGGIVAWLLLASSLIIGLVLSSRILGRKVSPAWTLSVHRFLGGLGVIFTAVHVAAIMLDDFVDFGVAEVLVPWASSWRPGAVAWGIVAMYLMIAIELTSFAMKRLPKRLWRGVHWMSGPLFATATLHGYQAGTDTGRAFVVATVAAIVVLALLTTVRVVRAKRAEPRADPRDLVHGSRGQREMRAEPPTHVLGALTLSNPPPVRVERPARPERVRELVTAGRGGPTEADSQAKRAPEWAAGACPPATSLADALPRVPDTPALVDAPAPRKVPSSALFDQASAVEQEATEGPGGAVARSGAPADLASVASGAADQRRPGPAPGVWKSSRRGPG